MHVCDASERVVSIIIGSQLVHAIHPPLLSAGQKLDPVHMRDYTMLCLGLFFIIIIIANPHSKDELR